MFNIAFPELMIILVIALFVIGPDKLPKIARGAGILVGRLQRYVSDIKTDIDNNLQAEDLKRLQAELEDHDMGLKEDLRRGMKPVESVLQESAMEKQQLQAGKNPNLSSVDTQIAKTKDGVPSLSNTASKTPQPEHVE